MTKQARPLDPLKEAEAAAALMQALGLTLGEDDDGLAADTVEGETSFFEALDAALERLVELNGLLEGLQGAAKRLDDRKARIANTIANLRASLEQALVVAGVETALPRPVGTVGLRKGTASLVVVEEAEIPATFWKAGDPKLDRKALGDALKERDALIAAASQIEDAEERARALAEVPPPIPGATLSNGAPSLNFRVA